MIVIRSYLEKLFTGYVQYMCLLYNLMIFSICFYNLLSAIFCFFEFLYYIWAYLSFFGDILTDNSGCKIKTGPNEMHVYLPLSPLGKLRMKTDIE